MKAIITLVSAFLLCSIVIQAQTTYVPDDNFEQALIDYELDDVLDDIVLTSNISGVTTLDLDSKSISDLTGIEDFTSLTDLSCSWNDLKSLDFTQNTDLTYLRCEFNQLTSIDVTQNLALSSLILSFNILISLDVTQNKALTELLLAGNQLISIDISQNLALARFSCFKNQLSSLDVTQNTALTVLSCFKNQLSSLDVTQNTALTTIYCEENQLTSLDVRNGNNGLITAFRAQDNPLLTCIDVDNDVGANTGSPPYDIWTKDASAIYAVDCSNIRYTYVPDNNFEQALIDLGYDDVLDDYVLTSNISGVTSLDMPSKNISDLTGIEDFISIEEFTCAHNLLTSLDVTQNTGLTYLRCEFNHLTNLDVTQNTVLTYLHCEHNQLTSLDLTQNSVLRDLYCYENQLTSLDVSNGNNGIILGFNATNNPSLQCIEVDNEKNANAALPPYAYWQKEATASYSEDCSLIPIAKSYVPGWNWFSLNVLADNMSLGNLLTCATQGDYIKNQTESATYYDIGGWFGSLANGDGLDPKDLYKIKTVNPCDVSYTGVPVDVLSTPIDIVSGWNWIGYLPQDPIPIIPDNIALGSLTLEQLDYLKNQTESATYYDIGGWFGSLNTLKPTEGYMMKKQTTDVLLYPESPPVAPAAKKLVSGQKDYHVSVDPYQFEFSGSLTAKVYVNGVLVGGEYDLILAYVGDQFRGVSGAYHFEPTNSYAYPMMVYSNMAEGETITFKYYNAESDQIYSCDETLIFKKDMIVANAYESFELNVNAALGIDESSLAHGLSLEAYPNPFKNQLQINYSVAERTKVRVAVYDVLGKPIEILKERTRNPGAYSTRWNAQNNMDGTYIIQITTENSTMRQVVFLVK